MSLLRIDKFIAERKQRGTYISTFMKMHKLPNNEAFEYMYFS